MLIISHEFLDVRFRSVFEGRKCLKKILLYFEAEKDFQEKTRTLLVWYHSPDWALLGDPPGEEPQDRAQNHLSLVPGGQASGRRPTCVA